MMWIVLAGCAAAVLAVVSGFLIRQLRRAKKECAELRLVSTRLIGAREKERRQIAEELHDSLGQDLLIINSRAQLGLATAVNSRTAQQLAEISKTCLSAINETREIAHSLGPRYLGQLGLTEALEAMIDRVAASTCIRM